MKKYSYNLTKTSVQVYRFRAEDAAYWADVTIDTAPEAKHGRISIASDFGNWQNYWGGCGSPFKKFLAGLDIHYAAGKFGADKFFNLNKTIQGIEEVAKEHPFRTDSDRKKVAREIDNLQSCSNNREEFVHILSGTCPNILHMYDGGPEIVTEVDPGFKNFWVQIWPDLLAEFQNEETNPEQDINKEYRLMGMTQGIAVAVNYLLRGENAEGIWRSGGMSIRECIAHKVDNFDLDRLIPEFATSDDAEAIANYYLQTDAEEYAEHRINAEEFITDLREASTSLGELQLALSNEEIKSEVEGKIQDQEAYIADAKEAYIEIVKTADR